MCFYVVTLATNIEHADASMQMQQKRSVGSAAGASTQCPCCISCRHQSCCMHLLTVMCELLTPTPHPARFPGCKEVLYGTATGTLVQLFIDGQSVKQGFVLANPGKLGAINALFSAVDYSRSGTSDVVVGRDDGSLEVGGRGN
jgi:hypothetical protein